MTRQCAARFINQDIISTIVIEANNIILQINAEDDVLEDEAGFHHIKHYKLPFCVPQLPHVLHALSSL